LKKWTKDNNWVLVLFRLAMGTGLTSLLMKYFLAKASLISLSLILALGKKTTCHYSATNQSFSTGKTIF
jgi:hypothetical protein